MERRMAILQDGFHERQKDRTALLPDWPQILVMQEILHERMKENLPASKKAGFLSYQTVSMTEIKRK
jgi:hypothetical protein